MRVLAVCLMEWGTKQLRNQTSDRLQTVILDVTKTESVAAATEWVKERVGDRGNTQISCLFTSLCVRALVVSSLGKIPRHFPGFEVPPVFTSPS